MSRVPNYYDYQNAISSTVNPLATYDLNNYTTQYFARYLLQKFISNFEFKNIPANWNKPYILYALACMGFFGVIKTVPYGVIPQICTLTGYNIYYQPKSILIANHLLPDYSGRELVIGEDCELVKLMPDYGCIMDMILKYATEYALTTQSFDVSVINSKIGYVFSASDNKTAESLKKMVDQINEGRPAVFIDKQLLNPDGVRSWESIFSDGRGSTVINELLNALEKLDARFNTDVGIPNVNISKASGVSDAEVNANNVDTMAKINLWIETINEDLQKVNNMFGLNISCKYRFERGVTEDADQIEADSNGNV